MADLDQVYGGISDNDNNNYNQMYDGEKNDYSQNDYATSLQQQAHQPQQVQQQKPVQQIQQIPQIPQMQQPAPRRQISSPSYSFWDRMVFKRNEVLKLAVFSLVILLAIALDKLSTFYLSKYLSENSMTDTQEFFMRLSYPIIVFLIIWVMKSL